MLEGVVVLEPGAEFLKDKWHESTHVLSRWQSHHHSAGYQVRIVFMPLDHRILLEQSSPSHLSRCPSDLSYRADHCRHMCNLPSAGTLAQSWTKRVPGRLIYRSHSISLRHIRISSASSSISPSKLFEKAATMRVGALLSTKSRFKKSQAASSNEPSCQIVATSNFRSI